MCTNVSLTIAEILSVSLLGTLLHSTYCWSGCNPLIDFIVPVDKSVWEHVKLLFFPMLLFGLWSLKGETDACRISAFYAGLLTGVLLMPVLYYSYASTLGHNILAVDITIFYIYIIAAFLIYHGPSGSCPLEEYSHVASMAMSLLLICLLPFIHSPPGSSIFKGPEG